MRTLLQAILRRLGADVLLAADGATAIKHIDTDLDRIVLDIMMPGMNGYDVLAHLAEHHPHLLSRTLILTAAGPRVDERVGTLTVVHKPFDPDRFLNALTTLPERGTLMTTLPTEWRAYAEAIRQATQLAMSTRPEHEEPQAGTSPMEVSPDDHALPRENDILPAEDGAYARAIMEAASDLRHNMRAPLFAIDGFLEIVESDLPGLLARLGTLPQPITPLLQTLARVEQSSSENTDDTDELDEPLTDADTATTLAEHAIRPEDIAGLAPEHAAWLSDLGILLDFVRRTRTAVNTLRLLTRGRTTLREHEMERVDVHATIRAAVALWDDKISQDQGAITMRLNANDCVIRGNAGTLAGVWTNLLENAHTAKPNIHVTISTTNASDQLTVSVTDDGPGIPDAIRASVFEPGVSTSGSGIGLDYVRRAVAAHQGTVALQSRPGETMFTFHFPTISDEFDS